MPTKLPPHDIPAEEAVNASLLVNGEAIYDVSLILQGKDFVSDQNRHIYEACLELYQRREAINQITVAQELDRKELLKKVGGDAYLGHLISSMPSSLEVIHYANIVHRLSLSRQLMSRGQEIINLGHLADPDVAKTIDTAQTMISGLRNGHKSLQHLVSAKDSAGDMIDMVANMGRVDPSIPWGWTDLDRATGGIFPGDYIIVAARPSVGKSQILCEAESSIARRGKKILTVSCEMLEEGINQRRISINLGYDLKDIRKHNLTRDQKDNIIQFAGQFSELPIHSLYGPQTLNEIYSEASRLKWDNGLDLIFVDYLQKIKDCNLRTAGNTRYERITYVSDYLCSMSKELEVPVVVACQLNRESVHRVDKRPELSDLKGSGDIEQDADVVILLHRPMDEATQEMASTLSARPAKMRQGGDEPAIYLNWYFEHKRYVNAARE